MVEEDGYPVFVANINVLFIYLQFYVFNRMLLINCLKFGSTSIKFSLFIFISSCDRVISIIYEFWFNF